jgi:hypothetical protein
MMIRPGVDRCMVAHDAAVAASLGDDDGRVFD